MKILVTGGSGFIGHNTVVALVEKGHSVLNLDLQAPPQKTYAGFWKQVDLRVLPALEETVLAFDPEVVIHLAARTDLDGKSLEDYSSNTLGTENLLTVLKKCHSLKRCIITSSMLVYKTGMVPSSQEDYKTTTYYGESKVITEQLTRKANLACTWLLVRPTSIWGPWFKEPYRNFFDMVLSRRFFRLGNKSSVKTFGFVGNTVHQLYSLMTAEHALVHKNVFYLGDAAVNIDEWSDCICKKSGLPQASVMPFVILKMAAYGGDILKLIGIKFPMTSFRLANMTISYEMDLKPVTNITGKLPYSLEQGVEKTLDWLKQTQN